MEWRDSHMTEGMSPSHTLFRRNAGSRPHSVIMPVVAVAAVMFAATGPALAESIERGNKFTTSWGELQTILINPSSGGPQSGIGTDPNSHRYKDRGGPTNFDNDRQRFERKKPDGTVLRLEF